MNLEFKVTKGKWIVKHSKSKPAFNIIGTQLGGRYKVAVCPYLINAELSEEFNNKEIDEAKANAQLIASAPGLLISLQKLLFGYNAMLSFDSINDQHKYKEAVDEAKKVISKALGNG